MERFRLLRSACIVFLLCAATAVASPAQTFTTLFSFDVTDGNDPNGLIQGADGNFYGITEIGGANNTCESGEGCGTIFEFTPAGDLTTLHSFNGTDGTGMGAVLIQGANGTFYGTSEQGGANGYGSFFSIIPGGSLITLYSFCSQANCSDGAYPTDLVQGADGNFYGTTVGTLYTGVNTCSLCGTLFKITAAGVLTTLYTFLGPEDPAPDYFSPYEPNTLVQGSDGNFYGTASGGNLLCGSQGDGDLLAYCGTVFTVTPAGAMTALYSFCTQPQCTDGYASSGLLQASDGNFYGTTRFGGNRCEEVILPLNSCGTVFKITPQGTFTTLHMFDWTDGAQPEEGSLIQGSDGNFYGTTSYGGSNGLGTIFKITPTGTLITLYNFVNGSSGSGLVQTAASFYGTTYNGGSDNDATIFSFSLATDGTTPSTISLSLSPASVSVGSTVPVVMTATVAPVSGGGTPTGVVAFSIGSTQLNSIDLSGGVATYSYDPSSLLLGTYQVTAIYSGDGTFAASTSSAQTLTISSLPTTATPTFSPASGTYSSAQTVTITDTTPGAVIYFTDDGTTPTTSSEVYNGPITVDSTETINAIAVAASDGYPSSLVATATYTIGLAPAYNLSVTPASLTIVAGQSGTAQFTVSPMNGFNSAVTFACSGLPSGATCSFQPSSVTPSGGNPVSSTLTVSTTAASAALRGLNPSANPLNYALLVPLFGMIFGVSPRLRLTPARLRVVGVLALMALVTGLTSCGGSALTSPGTTAVKSTVTVTASATASGATNQTASLTITITQ